MNRVLLISLALVLIGGAVGGSVAWANSGAAPNGGGEEVSVDASYDGTEVKVAVGGTVIVTLESNPSTGFSWALAGNSDEGVLQEVGHEYNPPEGDPPLVGAGGHEVWTFQALEKGTSTISMEYSRPWEGGEKGVETFELTVVVE